VPARFAAIAGCLALTAIGAIAGQPSRPEIAPFVGYRFGGAVTDATTGAGASLDGAGAFGLIFDVPVQRGADLEVLLSRQSTGVDLERYPEVTRFDLTVDHLMAGVRAHFPTRQRSVHPFLAVYVGLTHFSGDSGEVTADTRFAAALGGGAVFDLSPRVGVRLDARVYASFVESGAGLFCGGGGCSGVFGGSAMVQGEIAAALVVKL